MTHIGISMQDDRQHLLRLHARTGDMRVDERECCLVRDSPRSHSVFLQVGRGGGLFKCTDSEERRRRRIYSKPKHSGAHALEVVRTPDYHTHQRQWSTYNVRDQLRRVQSRVSQQVEKQSPRATAAVRGLTSRTRESSSPGTK